MGLEGLEDPGVKVVKPITPEKVCRIRKKLVV